MKESYMEEVIWRAEGRLTAVKGLIMAGDPGAAETQLETLAEELTRALDPRNQKQP